MMKAAITFIILISSIITSCTQKEVKNENKTLSGRQPPQLPEAKWLDSGKVALEIDTTLTHKKGAFKCDSVIILDYNGAFGEHTYLPLNDKGQWIATIKKTKRLSEDQLNFIQIIFGSKSSFKNPKMFFCYEPRIGLIYYRNNEVIAQSAICLSCCRMESTAKLGSGNNYASYNTETNEKIAKFYDQLNLQ